MDLWRLTECPALAKRLMQRGGLFADSRAAYPVTSAAILLAASSSSEGMACE